MSRQRQAVVVPVVAVFALAACVPSAGTTVSGHAVPNCHNVTVFVDTDERMREASAKLLENPRVRAVESRTKEENFADFKQIFADEPALVKLARVEAIPASIQVITAFDTDVRRFADDLRPEFGDQEVRYVDICAERPPSPTR